MVDFGIAMRKKTGQTPLIFWFVLAAAFLFSNALATNPALAETPAGQMQLLWTVEGADSGVPFKGLLDMAIDPVMERIYVLDHLPYRLLILDEYGVKIDAVDLEDIEDEPFGMAVRDGKIYLADPEGVRLISAKFEIGERIPYLYESPNAQQNESGAALPFDPNDFRAFFVDDSGYWYIQDEKLKGVHRFSPDGKWHSLMGGGGIRGKKAVYPSVAGITFDPYRSRWTALLDGGERAMATGMKGRKLGEVNFANFDPDGGRGIMPLFAAIDSKNRILALDRLDHSLWAFGLTGFALFTVPSGYQEGFFFEEPRRVLLDQDDILYRMDVMAGRVAAFEILAPGDVDF